MGWKGSWVPCLRILKLRMLELKTIVRHGPTAIGLVPLKPCPVLFKTSSGVPGTDALRIAVIPIALLV